MYVDPDQMPNSLASDLGLHCFLRPVYPSTLGYYLSLFKWSIYYVNTLAKVFIPWVKTSSFVIQGSLNHGYEYS